MITDSGSAIVERGVRLLQLQQSPGWMDLVRISEALAAEAQETCTRFAGWDKDQIAALQQRAKSCLEFHEKLFSTIHEYIAASQQEMLEQSLQSRSEEQVLTDADELRAMALEESEKVDTRIPGTYI